MKLAAAVLVATTILFGGLTGIGHANFYTCTCMGPLHTDRNGIESRSGPCSGPGYFAAYNGTVQHCFAAEGLTQYINSFLRSLLTAPGGPLAVYDKLTGWECRQ